MLCGVVGAIVINRIDRFVATQQKNDNLDSQIEKKNEILQTQDKLIDVKVRKMTDTKEHVIQSMMENRERAKDMISEAMATIFREDEEDNTERLDNTADELAKLLE